MLTEPNPTWHEYQRICTDLQNGAKPSDVPNLSRFLDQDISRLSTDTAYQLLMTSSFEADVLFEFLSKELEAVVAAETSKAASTAESQKQRLAWVGGWGAEAVLTAYKRTAQARFLDLFVTYFESALKLRDSERGLYDHYHNRIMQTWGVETGIGNERAASIVLAGRIVYPATEFARIVQGNPLLESFARTAQRYIDAAATALNEFEEDFKAVEGEPVFYYVRPPGPHSARAKRTFGVEPEPLNHVHSAGSAFLNLFKLTGEQKYKERVDAILEVFMRSVKWADNGTVFWRYHPYYEHRLRKDEVSEPVWKAGQTITFPVRAFADGFNVPRQLIEAIADTFLVNIVRDKNVLRNLSPLQSRLLKTKDITDGRTLRRLGGIVSWLEYTIVRPEIADRLKWLIAVRRDLFPGGWLASTNIARGYAHFLSSK